MLAIRLARTGRKKYPTYRIVAAESARPVTGKFVAILGHYNPHTKEIVIKKDETLKYLGNGAQPSNAVIRLLTKEKIDLPKWVTLKTRNRAPKKAVEDTPAPAAPAPDQPAAVADEATDQPATESTETVATTAAAAEEAAEDQAIADTDVDSDHTETASTQTAQEEAATAADDAAASAAGADGSKPSDS